MASFLEGLILSSLTPPPLPISSVLCPVIPLDKEEPYGGKMLSRTWLSTSFVIKESLMITVFNNG